MTSMLIPKKTGNLETEITYRYYYKCETIKCEMRMKSIRAGSVIDCVQDFFESYLFITESNYKYFLNTAEKQLQVKSAELKRNQKRLNASIANKKKSYENIKKLIISSPELKKHYNLNDYADEIAKLKSEYESTKDNISNIKSSIPTFSEYLKLFKSTPVILGKIRNMEDMDKLLKYFFSNFTIIPTREGTFKGSNIGYKLKEPWNGFVKNNDFVCGAG